MIPRRRDDGLFVERAKTYFQKENDIGFTHKAFNVGMLRTMSGDGWLRSGDDCLKKVEKQKKSRPISSDPGWVRERNKVPSCTYDLALFL